MSPLVDIAFLEKWGNLYIVLMTALTKTENSSQMLALVSVFQWIYSQLLISAFVIILA